MLQAWFIQRFEVLIFQAWLEMALLYRKIKLPFFKFDKFNVPYFQGRRWDWVDPLKDIDAIDRAIEIGLTSRRAEVAKKGGNILDIAKEQKADNELSDRYGLKWGEQPGSLGATTQPPDNTEEIPSGAGATETVDDLTPAKPEQDTEPA
jgi:capsid protein